MVNLMQIKSQVGTIFHYLPCIINGNESFTIQLDTFGIKLKNRIASFALLFETIAIAIGNESSTLHFNLLALKCSKRKCVKIQSR